MRVHENRAKYLLRYLGVYIGYAICMIATLILVFVAWQCMSSIDADFEASSEYVSESENMEDIKVAYNYFLDFSPSMQGFLYTDLNTDLKKVANAFEQINAVNDNNHFYWCRDSIYSVNAASDFYESMRSDDILDQYYGGIIRNGSLSGDEEGRNEIDQVIENINLSNIFFSTYMTTAEPNTDCLNVVVTDLNFLKNSNDLEGHNSLLDSFALRLGQTAANDNICIYAFNSNYAGTGNDVYEGVRGNVVTVPFYVIVFSDNESKYMDYCQRFEGVVDLGHGQKFELRNRINSETPTLEGDLNAFRALNLEMTKENLNYANGVFKNIEQNELALQLVTTGSSRAIYAAPIAEVNFSGYNVPETLGLDDSKINVEIELYKSHRRLGGQSSYEFYEDTSMIAEKSAGMYYIADRWFLRVNLAFSTHPDVLSSDGLYQKALDKMRRGYIVMNLKFYMERPSFSKPEWVSAINSPYLISSEMYNIERVIDSVMRYKEEAYMAQPQADRYLGNKVIYVLY